MFDWYLFEYADGYRYVERDLSTKAIQADEQIHGSLVSKEFYGWF